MSYSIDTTSHIDADRNRNLLQGSFLFTQQVPGLTKEQRIQLMHDAKERIRRRDAEPAAWFVGPTRAKWVEARMDLGEFKGKSDEELGRALTGQEAA
ncbi:hypothetical protein [Billgrantia montanilacus]|uniref:Uncharacterized protein n=1 Tax=Billgrantia montanilacus TaxID=2282305 RepID=A0A368TT46_9GAMM|nr:hypothetical protein [Halomonas montanilacus]RCV87496.1 hypothetical protein DU505_17135 [Halomonas montanilacus]